MERAFYLNKDKTEGRKSHTQTANESGWSKGLAKGGTLALGDVHAKDVECKGSATKD